ncbi:MAG: helix-turn-helix transcriptional regulator ['Candidatus Kapabacteria' thiocyanatum]|uniref:HTH cro/C1-type domain-containing protein n=1 Tax=Candidatus Kapaibacterium thiocyanatum TaxID=1895771 RepID=A0A1M3L3Y4_9BACT|nr:helix-turn-helix transcriptional regulator ['Candidatus Kapabacteria' thiocyanatum]OJX59980.1 MAG: hypothetical protein BGO89_08285 ['Candidatus Kapabacteria' thiocyanatum]
MARPLKELVIHKGQKASTAQALGLLIRERRLELGLSQEAVSDEGLEQAYVSKLERGESEISLNSFLLLAPKLQLTPVELLQRFLSTLGRHGK